MSKVIQLVTSVFSEMKFVLSLPNVNKNKKSVLEISVKDKR